MNITKLPFIVIVFLISIASLQSEADFILHGQGTVFDGSELGVPGESVEFTFSYDLSDFSNNSSFPNVATYYAINPIPVEVIGSISGRFSGIDPVSRAVIFDDSSGTGYDVWHFKVAGGSSSASALVAANSSGDEFNNPLPDSFAEAHNIFFPEHTNPLIWTQDSTGIFLADNGTKQLGLNDLQWTIAPVPIPAAAWLFGSALIGLAGIKRRK
jgi:hypothetical protein